MANGDKATSTPSTRSVAGQPVAARSGRWPVGLLPLAAIALLSLLVAGCGSDRPGAYQYHWNYFFDAVFHPDRQILGGLGLTVLVSILSQFIGVVLGVFAAIGKLARKRLFRWIASIYIWLFRGTPLVVQIVFFFFGLSVTRIYNWPPITIFGVTVEGAIQAGIFALGLNEGAYMAEIVRAGILSIDPGQMEAAKSLGMTYPTAMRRIVLPQAARVIVPPLGNEFNNMLKTTALLVLISVPELYTILSRKAGQLFAPFELLLAAAVWFLLLTTIWGIVQARIERRLGRSTAASSDQPGLRQRIIGYRFGSGQSGYH